MPTAIDMYYRVQGSRSELIRRRSSRARIRQMYLEGLSKHNAQPHGKTIDPEILAAVRAEIRENIRKENRRRIWISILCVFLGLLAIAGLLLMVRYFLSNSAGFNLPGTMGRACVIPFL